MSNYTKLSKAELITALKNKDRDIVISGQNWMDEMEKMEDKMLELETANLDDIIGDNSQMLKDEIATLQSEIKGLLDDKTLLYAKIKDLESRIRIQSETIKNVDGKQDEINGIFGDLKSQIVERNDIIVEQLIEIAELKDNSTI